MASLAMYVAAATALVFAALMVVQRSLYVSAVCLLVVLLQTAVMFFFAGAPLLAFLQVMIYAGAVMVLIVVTVTAASPASPGDAPAALSRLSIPWPLAAAGLAAPLVESAVLVGRGALAPGALGAAAAAQARLGAVLFGPYAVATEAVTFLLLLSALAVVGRAGGDA